MNEMAPLLNPHGFFKETKVECDSSWLDSDEERRSYFSVSEAGSEGEVWLNLSWVV